MSARILRQQLRRRDQGESTMAPEGSAPRRFADDKSDDNADDSCTHTYGHTCPKAGVSCLVRPSAQYWQCGGQGFESP